VLRQAFFHYEFIEKYGKNFDEKYKTHDVVFRTIFRRGECRFTVMIFKLAIYKGTVMLFLSHNSPVWMLTLIALAIEVFPVLVTPLKGCKKGAILHPLYAT